MELIQCSTCPYIFFSTNKEEKICIDCKKKDIIKAWGLENLFLRNSTEFKPY